MKNKIIKTFILIIAIILMILPNIVMAQNNAESKLTKFYIKTSEGKIGEKIYVEMNLDKVDATTSVGVNFRCSQTGDNFKADVQDIDTNNPYFILPDTVQVGNKYELFYIGVQDSNGGTTYSTYNIQGSTSSTYINCLGKKYVTVLKQDETVSLDDISIKGNREVAPGDKLYFDIKTTGEVDFMTMIIKHKEIESSKFLLSIQNLEDQPYLDLSNLGTQR